MKLDIIQENKNYLIINKPAGLIVHSGNGIKEKTLTDYLLETYPEIANVGDDPNRPGIVHRLDKEASGLMIITRNNEAFEYFKSQFKNRKIDKEYTALVCGKLSKDQDVIDFPIKRSSQGFKMAAIPSPKNENELELLRSGRGEYANYLEEYNKINNNLEKETEETKENEEDKKINNRAEGGLKALEKSRQAITEYKIIKRFINFTLIKAKIKTGRTHQIRVHFFAYGHPLLGDNLYKNKKSKVQNQKVKPERIFLLADKLGFKDMEDNWQEFNIELDENLKNILDRIK